MLVAAVGLAGLLGIGLGIAVALRPPTLPVPERRSWVFRDVVLVEPGRPPRAGTLRVADGKIHSITGSAGASESAEEAHDLAGSFVTPGLVDMHVHYPPAVAVGNAELWSLLFLAHGVTSVREMGSIDGSIFAVRERIRAGERPGPRIFACGAMLDGQPPSFPTNRVVRTPAEARAAVAEQAEAGADCVKVYNMLEPEVLASIRTAAAEASLPLVGHAPHSVRLEQAGIADLQHGTGAVLVDLAQVDGQDFRPEDWASVDDARIDHVARVSREQGIAHTPTLVNARMRLLVGSGFDDARVARDTGLRHLPRFWAGVWKLLWAAPFAAGDRDAERVHRRFRARQAALAAGLHRAGVPVHAGTDTLMPYVAPGSSLHGELAELVGAGLSPRDAWGIATREAGAALGAPGLGTLAIGAPADLIFLDSDPRGDLPAPTRLVAVLVDGRLYRRSDLEDGLARFDAHFHGRLYETVMGAVASLLQSGFAPERDSDG